MNFFFKNRRKIMTSALAFPLFYSANLFSLSRKNIPFVKDMDFVLTNKLILLNKLHLIIIFMTGLAKETLCLIQIDLKLMNGLNIDGLVKNYLNADDLIKKYQLEERIYRSNV